MNDTQILVNQTEQQKPVMESKKREWTRTTFDNFAGRIWCYRIKKTNKRGDKWLKGYYCYGCKGDLIFKALDEYNRENPPFRFHKLLVKVLEKKDDDWKTGRKTRSYYAFCCKCAAKDEYDGTVKENKWTKKWLGFEIENCDCQEWIGNETKKTRQEIKEYKEKVRQSQILKICVDKLGKERFSESYLLGRVQDISKTEENKTADYQELIKDKENYLQQLAKWENNLTEFSKYLQISEN